MGWDVCYRAPGVTSKAFFKGKMGEDLLDIRVKGNVAYGAYRGKDGHIFAVVILMARRKDPYFNFAYKAMDEAMGPFNYDCPAAILSLLTAPTNDYAREWRAMQRTAVKQMKASKPVSVVA